MKKFGRLVPVVDFFLYRNQITICAGGPYAGKSRLSMFLANALSLGSKTFLGTYDPMKVLYCSERDWDFNSEQLKTVGITSLNTNLHFFCIPDIPEKKVTSFDFDPLQYIAAQELQDWSPDLVILDTAPHFQPVKGGMGEPTNSYSFNRKELLKTKRWATKHDTSILVVYHSPKQNEKNKYLDPFDKILGSTAILASSVAASVLERQSDKELLVHFRSHVSVMQSPILLDYNDFSDTKTVVPTLTLVESLVYKEVPEDAMPLAEFVNSVMNRLGKSRTHIYNIVMNLAKKGWIEVRINHTTEEKLVKKLTPQ